MMKKIFNNLQRPFKIPGKIIPKLRNLKSKIEFIKNKKKYKKEIYENRQNQTFKALNLDRELGLIKLNEIRKKYKFLNDQGMSSEHEVLFSSLSLNLKNEIKEILEIGTFDGSNAFLLSELFKNSNIETIDLDSNKSDFKDFYNRKDKMNKFLDMRNKNLARSNRVKFTAMNSINLINHKKNYDLIWIDGAHGYPIACMDILNSLKLVNKNGIILCDDIFINKINSDRMYRSMASFETLNSLKEEKLINFDLIFKRLNVDNNCVEKNRKFIGIISLT